MMCWFKRRRSPPPPPEAPVAPDPPIPSCVQPEFPPTPPLSRQIGGMVFRKVYEWSWWDRMLRRKGWTPAGRMTARQWGAWHKDEAAAFDKECKRILKEFGLD